MKGKILVEVENRSKYEITKLQQSFHEVIYTSYTSVFVPTETCPCPKALYTNWAELPPYVTKPVNNESPQGIVGSLVEEMILKSCGICRDGYGPTVLNFSHSGKGRVAYKRTINAVREDVDHRTQVSFPIIGAMDDAKFQREYVFVPLVESPGIAFITVSQDTSSTSAISAIIQYLPLYLFCLTMAYAAGIIVWALVSIFPTDLNKIDS